MTSSAERIGLDTLQRDRGLRHRAGHAGEVLHGLEELLQVGEVDRQRAGRHRARNDQRGALPEHDGRADRHHDTDHGRHQRFDLACAKRRRDSRAACGLQMRDLDILAAERLGHADRTQSVLNDGQHVALPLAYRASRFLDRLLEMKDENQEHGRECDGDEGKIPIHPQHQPHHEDDGEEIDHDVERG